MSILVGNDTKLVVTGLTGREGSFHGLNNRRYGTDLVAGVTPGKGGQDVEGVPVFNTLAEAVSEAGANQVIIAGRNRFQNVQQADGRFEQRNGAADEPGGVSVVRPL